MRNLSDNLVGAGFMVAAMAGFALEDMLLKSASAQMPVGQVIALFGLFGTIGFAALSLLRSEPVLHPAMLAPSMVLRAGFECCGRLFYTLAIALTPLSTASAILQATPLVVVAGAAMVFRERVGAGRWLAICAGFGGVLLILRPGATGFDATAVVAILGMAGFAGRDLATRAAPRSLSFAQIGLCGFSVLVPTGLLLLAVTGGAAVPATSAVLSLLAGTGFGIAAYSALTQAMRVGEVSAVTPFRYTRLIFGVGLGIAVFGERPGIMTWGGAAIILASGLYIMLRRPARAERLVAAGPQGMDL
ncbi:DMT family transporter [Tropicimonas sp. IMCC6043]|uniref:DMT family transporter n=1 Tax=Tropicimonas sp. IMCC6043 TaxID=2510645 RepID=UPI00101C2CCE|nr:DMT family transporter [Tropicimonas sp. IMCC6043]RYH08542.1 DMT family transporter [Tropicimonas sp. IMCC6043]